MSVLYLSAGTPLLLGPRTVSGVQWTLIHHDLKTGDLFWLPALQFCAMIGQSCCLGAVAKLHMEAEACGRAELLS